MKKLGMAFSLLMLLVLVGCDADQQVEPTTGRMRDALECAEKSSSRCGVDWQFKFDRDGLAENLIIYVNGKAIINDCDPKSYWSREVLLDTTRYIVRDYMDIGQGEEFAVRIFGKEECSDERDERVYVAKYKPKVKTIGGIKVVTVEGL